MDAASPLPALEPTPNTSKQQAEETQTCPGCGEDMPGRKGARLSICPVCGYKESCCY